jgi:hypothetical protein
MASVAYENWNVAEGCPPRPRAPPFDGVAEQNNDVRDVLGPRVCPVRELGLETWVLYAERAVIEPLARSTCAAGNNSFVITCLPVMLAMRRCGVLIIVASLDLASSI